MKIARLLCLGAVAALALCVSPVQARDPGRGAPASLRPVSLESSDREAPAAPHCLECQSVVPARLDWRGCLPATRDLIRVAIPGDCHAPPVPSALWSRRADGWSDRVRQSVGIGKARSG